MGRKQAYSEDLLTEAVLKYAETHADTIKVTKLAAWSSVNIDGLQGVRDYHFTRDVVEKDPVTGKKKKRKRVCAERIDSINASRSITRKVSTNLILRSTNPNLFLELSRSEQIRTILEAKELFNRVEKINAELSLNNNRLQAVNEICKEKYLDIDRMLKEINKELSKYERMVNYVLKHTDTDSRKKMLEEMGITDGNNFDIVKYKESLRLDVENVFNINKSIASFFEANTTDHEDMMTLANIKDSLLDVFDD